MLEFHPMANIFPLMTDKEIQDLAADIKSNGLQESIVIHEGKILDGRNRYRACEIAGVEPATVNYDGDDELAYVISLNLHRRHLTESQRAMVAANVANIENSDFAGNRHTKNLDCANLRSLKISQPQAADMLNVSRRSVQEAKKIHDHGTPDLADMVTSGQVSVSSAAQVATLPEPEQQEIVAKGEKEIMAAAKEIRQRKTERRKAERMQNLAKINEGNELLPELKKYPVIYCDPPWRYQYTNTDNRAIENQYPTMSHDELCALDIDSIAYDDCIMFMWATSPKLNEAMDLLKAWGFDYKTCAIWDKQKMGMGYYFRQQHELILIATKGQPPAPAPGDRQRSIISEPRGKHSAKPEQFYEIIEAMYPELDKIELFCRSPREGWNVWGNQAK